MDAVAPPKPASVASHQETLMANSRLTFEDKVVEKIAAICAQNVDGILGMDGSVMDNLTYSLPNLTELPALVEKIAS